MPYDPWPPVPGQGPGALGATATTVRTPVCDSGIPPAGPPVHDPVMVRRIALRRALVHLLLADAAGQSPTSSGSPTPAVPSWVNWCGVPGPDGSHRILLGRVAPRESRRRRQRVRQPGPTTVRSSGSPPCPYPGGAHLLAGPGTAATATAAVIVSAGRTRRLARLWVSSACGVSVGRGVRVGRMVEAGFAVSPAFGVAVVRAPRPPRRLRRLGWLRAVAGSSDSDGWVVSSLVGPTVGGGLSDGFACPLPRSNAPTPTAPTGQRSRGDTRAGRRREPGRGPRIGRPPVVATPQASRIVTRNAPIEPPRPGRRRPDDESWRRLRRRSRP